VSDTIHVVCPNCDAVNRIPRDRPALQVVCGQCRARLFEGRRIELEARQSGLTNLATLQNWVRQFSN
jgi:thioredoxin 2